MLSSARINVAATSGAGAAAIVGGVAGKSQGGRHIGYKTDTPVSNLWVTVLDKVGVPVEKFGDSTGKLDYLSI